MTEMIDVSHKDFKAAIVKIFQRVIVCTFETHIKSRKSQQRNSIIKQIKGTMKNQMENLEPKNAKIKIKISVERHNNKDNKGKNRWMVKEKKSNYSI